jgi:hypothetical protein
MHREVCMGARDLQGLERLYQEAVAVLNLCGSREPPEIALGGATMVYVETDPGLNQVRVAEKNERTLRELRAYNVHFSYVDGMGGPVNSLPQGEFQWLETRPPVIVEWWQPDPGTPPRNVLTTVANWKHETKDLEWQGKKIAWSKHEQFLKYLDLPGRVPMDLEIAIGSATDEEIESFASRGWKWIGSRSLDNPDAYRDYIRSSGGEFSVAKEQYVYFNTGWFSDRTVCYLAAGRPAVLQATGFHRYLPTGRGVFAFSTMEEAVDGISAIAADPRQHEEAAVELAHVYFRGEKVLGEMFTKIGLL